MIKNICLFALVIVSFASCKKECNSSTKIGFYYFDSTLNKGEPEKYQLFIDNVYKGDISVLNYTAKMGDANLLNCMLDGQRHELDVKNSKNEYINSEYIQITKNKVKSGTGKNSGKLVKPSNGSSCNMQDNSESAVFCFFN